MKTAIRTLIPVLLLASPALAQPAPDDPSMTPPPPETTPPPEPTPPPPPPTTTMAPTMAPEAPAEERPLGTSLGVGVGYVFASGVDLQQPNIATARFRLASGLTFEPEVLIGLARRNQDDGTDETTDGAFQLTVGALARVPIMRRGKFDLEFLGGARLSMLVDDPDGDDNGTTTTAASVQWGLAVNYWITPHWSLSMGATNPLLAVTRTSMETPGDDVSETTTSFIAAWDPTVTGMVHLFF